MLKVDQVLFRKILRCKKIDEIKKLLIKRLIKKIYLNFNSSQFIVSQVSDIYSLLKVVIRIGLDALLACIVFGKDKHYPLLYIQVKLISLD